MPHQQRSCIGECHIFSGLSTPLTLAQPSEHPWDKIAKKWERLGRSRCKTRACSGGQGPDVYLCLLVCAHGGASVALSEEERQKGLQAIEDQRRAEEEEVDRALEEQAQRYQDLLDHYGVEDEQELQDAQDADSL